MISLNRARLSFKVRALVLFSVLGISSPMCAKAQTVSLDFFPTSAEPILTTSNGPTIRVRRDREQSVTF